MGATYSLGIQGFLEDSLSHSEKVNALNKLVRTYNVGYFCEVIDEKVYFFNAENLENTSENITDSDLGIKVLEYYKNKAHYGSLTYTEWSYFGYNIVSFEDLGPNSAHKKYFNFGTIDNCCVTAGWELLNHIKNILSDNSFNTDKDIIGLPDFYKFLQKTRVFCNDNNVAMLIGIRG